MDSYLQKQQEAYDRGWTRSLSIGKEQHGNLQVDLRFLEEINIIAPGQSILEIGCGIGTITHILTQKGCCVTGTDISQQAISYARQKYPGIPFQVEAAEHLSFADQSLDIVISFDLFEHLKNVDVHLLEVRRVLREGGYYLLGTPNKYCSALFATLRSRNLNWKLAHPSLNSAAQLRRRLRHHGFNCRFIKMNTINDFILNKLSSLGPLPKLLKCIDTSRLPLYLQTNFYVVSRKC